MSQETVDWQGYVNEMLREPVSDPEGYGVAPHHPAPGVAPTPEPTPVPVGTTVVSIRRDSMGSIVEKTTVEGVQPTTSPFGWLLLATLVAVGLGWLLHRVMSPPRPVEASGPRTSAAVAVRGAARR
jgi:hypothetical protein